MALRDWDIVEDTAYRQINGREIAVKANGLGNLSLAVAMYEAREQQRMQARLIELGSLVDGALDRLRTPRAK